MQKEQMLCKEHYPLLLHLRAQLEMPSADTHPNEAQPHGHRPRLNWRDALRGISSNSLLRHQTPFCCRSPQAYAQGLAAAALLIAERKPEPMKSLSRCHLGGEPQHRLLESGILAPLCPGGREELAGIKA